MRTSQAMHPTAPFDETHFVRTVETLSGQQDTSALLDLLREQNRVYEEQSARRIVKMRGWILVALSRHELPDAALPFVLEELETSLEPYLVGAAALALRAYGQPRAEFASFILRGLKNIHTHDQPLSFDHYGDYGRAATSPTAVGELLATAEWLGPRGQALEPGLRELKQGGTLPRHVQGDLDAALEAIRASTEEEPKTQECCALIRSLARSSSPVWERSDSSMIDAIVFEDQDGRSTTYREFFHGAPTIVVFFYTRCDNPLKCSLSIWKLGNVQKLLEGRGMAHRIRTAAITYDPEFDDSKRLLTFGRNRGLKVDGNNRLLRAVSGIAPLRSHFGLGVTFASGLVNRHRIEIILLDKHGRAARSFTRLHWDEGQVVDEAVALVSEEHAPPFSSNLLSKAFAATGPVSAVVMACLPKCPLCWAAYLSAAGITAIGPNAYPRVLQAVVVLLLIHLASMYHRARSTRHWLGLAMSVTGTVILIVSISSGMRIQTFGSVLIGIGALMNAVGQDLLRWVSRSMRAARSAGLRKTAA